MCSGCAWTTAWKLVSVRAIAQRWMPRCETSSVVGRAKSLRRDVNRCADRAVVLDLEHGQIRLRVGHHLAQPPPRSRDDQGRPRQLRRGLLSLRQGQGKRLLAREQVGHLGHRPAQRHGNVARRALGRADLGQMLAGLAQQPHDAVQIGIRVGYCHLRLLFGYRTAS